MTRAISEWVGAHPDQAIPPRVRLTEEDILARVQTEANTGCWLWERGSEASGYGSWPRPGGGKERAHRVAYIIAKGPIPKGLFVCHRCDTPACVNPSHLFLGDHAANMADCSRKGRVKTPGFKGVDHHSAKLTEDDVRAIRADSRNGAAVGRSYGVGRGTISYIRKRKTWGHVA